MVGILQSVVIRSARVLPKKDRKKLVYIIFLQVFLGFLDLLGVAFIGVLGALAVNGIQSRPPGDRVMQVLQVLQIDDHNFQNRVFKKVLQELKIPERVLYAARHTFGSRCVDGGMTPVMTAFLMGNNPETALRRYTHQISLPADLPEI